MVTVRTELALVFRRRHRIHVTFKDRTDGNLRAVIELARCGNLRVEWIPGLGFFRVNVLIHIGVRFTIWMTCAGAAPSAVDCATAE